MSKINRLLRRIIKFFGSMRLALGSLLFAGLLSAIAALFFFGWLADEMLDGDTSNFDESVRNFVHEFASPTLTTVMQNGEFSRLDAVSNRFSVWAVFIVLYFRKTPARRDSFYNHNRWRKSPSRRPQARLSPRSSRTFFRHDSARFIQFPKRSFARCILFFTEALAAILAARTENIWLKIIVFIMSSVMILTIGISRIYLGVHYPSDVVAGFAVGLIWVVTIAVGDKLIHAKDKKCCVDH